MKSVEHHKQGVQRFHCWKSWDDLPTYIISKFIDFLPFVEQCAFALLSKECYGIALNCKIIDLSNFSQCYGIDELRQLLCILDGIEPHTIIFDRLNIANQKIYAMPTSFPSVWFEQAWIHDAVIFRIVSRMMNPDSNQIVSESKMDDSNKEYKMSKTLKYLDIPIDVLDKYKVLPNNKLVLRTGIQQIEKTTGYYRKHLKFINLLTLGNDNVYMNQIKDLTLNITVLYEYFLVLQNKEMHLSNNIEQLTFESENFLTDYTGGGGYYDGPIKTLLMFFNFKSNLNLLFSNFVQYYNLKRLIFRRIIFDCTFDQLLEYICSNVKVDDTNESKFINLKYLEMDKCIFRKNNSEAPVPDINDDLILKSRKERINLDILKIVYKKVTIFDLISIAQHFGHNLKQLLFIQCELNIEANISQLCIFKYFKQLLKLYCLESNDILNICDTEYYCEKMRIGQLFIHNALNLNIPIVAGPGEYGVFRNRCKLFSQWRNKYDEMEKLLKQFVFNKRPQISQPKLVFTKSNSLSYKSYKEKVEISKKIENGIRNGSVYIARKKRLSFGKSLRLGNDDKNMNIEEKFDIILSKVNKNEIINCKYCQLKMNKNKIFEHWQCNCPNYKIKCGVCESNKLIERCKMTQHWITECENYKINYFI